MLEIGKTVSLEVLRSVPMGVILGSPEDEVLLPTRVVPQGASAGDLVEVFLYTDSEDRPIATTEKPRAEAGQFACLRVVSVSSAGAFLDWGLPKDLLLPFRLQVEHVLPEQRVVVRVMLDSVSGRLVATTKIERQLVDPPDRLREGQAVQVLVYEVTELGSKAIVDGRFGGLFYRAPGDRELELGFSGTAYVQQIRSDGKINLTLAASGRAGLDDAREILLQALLCAGGRLELCDRSEPEAIRRLVGLSKKAFKRAVGALYRERRLRMGESSIELLERGDDPAIASAPR